MKASRALYLITGAALHGAALGLGNVQGFDIPLTVAICCGIAALIFDYNEY